MTDSDLSAQQRFTASLPGRLEAIETGVRGCATEPESESLQDAILAAHSLAGSAALFGHASLGEIARDMEELLQGIHSAGQAPSEIRERELAEKLVLLREASDQPDFRADSAPGDDLAPRLPDNSNRRVLLLEDDADYVNEICRQLAGFNWEVDAAANAIEALALLRQRSYLALIADVMLPEGPLAGTELADALPSGAALPPTIFVSRRWDWEARLASVRADAVSYLPKPVDTSRLAETLDSIQRPEDSGAGRILLVDDDDILTAHFSRVLENAGHRVIALQDPSELLEVLPSFNPDLLVLDLHMPGCNGIEVSKVIRQDDANAALPILFLSADRNQRPEREAIKAGADDFLLKPINDEWLVAAVEARVKRARAIQSLSQRDSLTGLLNHLAITGEVEQEASAVTRSGAPACFAMLDIDLFKEVNDTHGHPVGDRVIRATAQLLRQRLRRSDAVGRYGGEEFALVLRDTSLENAMALVERLRELFAAIQFSSNGTTFNATVSMGVCELHAGETVDSIVKRADDALYQAKREGRNQVRAADT